jgi:hypothetical protein
VPLVLQRGPLRPVEQALRTESSFQRKLHRMLVAATIVGSVALAPEMSAAEGLLDFFFGGGQKQQHQTDDNPQSPPPRTVGVSAGPAFCVRSIRVGNDQNPDFTPVASSPGRTP